MGVGEKPEIVEQEVPDQERGTGGNGGNGRRGSARKTARKRANASDVEVPIEESSPGRDRRASRERSLHRLLAGLRAVNAGDFSVELTPNGDPLMAEIIDVFNGVVQKQARLTDEISARQHVGGTRRQDERSLGRFPGWRGSGVTTVDAVNSLITDLVQPTSEVSRVIQAVAEGDSVAEGGAGDRGQDGAGRVPAHRFDREPNGRSAQLVRERSDTRGARSGNGGRARRSGERAGRRWHVEGSHRLGERDGVEPDEPGAKHRARDDGGRQRRSVAQDHRRSEGRSARAEGHDQHDGRSAVRVSRRK